MELRTRRNIHTAIAQSPADEWTAQQLREATPWGSDPKYLLRDHDSKYGLHFSAVVKGSGITELKTPYRAPRANGICERFMGSLKRECLDHILIFRGQQLRRVVKEFTIYFNQEWPHQGMGQQIPDYRCNGKSSELGRLCLERLGRLKRGCDPQIVSLA